MKRPIESDYTSFVAYARALEQYCDEAEKQEPVAKNESGRITWLVDNWPQNCLLYTHPPKREPLTDEQKVVLCKQFPNSLTFDAITAIEAAHGIKGEA